MAELSDLPNPGDLDNAAFIARELALFPIINRGTVTFGSDGSAAESNVFRLVVIGRPDIPQVLLSKEQLTAFYSVFSSSYVPDNVTAEMVFRVIDRLTPFVQPGDFTTAGALNRRLGLGQIPQQPGKGGPTLSFIGDLIGGIGDGIKAVVTNLPTIAQGVAQVTGSIQSIQGSLSGMPPVAVNPNTGTPMSGGDAAQMAFAQACNADPTGQCQAAIRAALQGGGAMTMPINPMTGAPVQIQTAGLLDSALRNPQVISVLKSLGFGALVAGGEALASGVAGLLSGGGGATASGPLLMAWPAGTRYPRSLVLRAPDQPEKRFRSVGAPLLMSGDVSAVRRVTKAAARARKGRGRRSPSRQPVYALQAGSHNVCGSCLTSPCTGGCKG